MFNFKKKRKQARQFETAMSILDSHIKYTENAYEITSICDDSVSKDIAKGYSAQLDALYSLKSAFNKLKGA